MKSSTLGWAGIGIWCTSVAVGVVACDRSDRDGGQLAAPATAPLAAQAPLTKPVDVSSASNGESSSRH